MKSYHFVIIVLSAFAASCSITPSNAVPSNSVNAASLEPPANNIPMIVMRKGEGAFGGASFIVSIYPDGKVHYEPHYTTSMNDVMSGNKPKPSPTPADWMITPEQFQSLLASFAKADFLDLKDRYQSVEDGCPTHAEDLPSIELTLTLRDRSKKIDHSLGCVESGGGPAYPRQLREVEGTIEDVALKGHTRSQ
jgi:hypothetical protein